MTKVFFIFAILGLICAPAIFSAVMTPDPVATALLGAGLTGLPFARRLAKAIRQDV
jgi:hypothetical protein